MAQPATATPRPSQGGSGWCRESGGLGGVRPRPRARLSRRGQPRGLGEIAVFRMSVRPAGAAVTSPGVGELWDRCAGSVRSALFSRRPARPKNRPGGGSASACLAACSAGVAKPTMFGGDARLVILSGHRRSAGWAFQGGRKDGTERRLGLPLVRCLVADRPLRPPRPGCPAPLAPPRVTSRSTTSPRR